MADEADFIARLRDLALDPGARGLADDAAVIELGDRHLVLTHDALVEGVHFLPGDPAESVAWKLVAVNISDLAAKGARPLGALMGYTLRGDAGWDEGFVVGLARALAEFGVPLLGGDTVRGGERHLAMTLIGEAPVVPPARSGAREGDMLFVSGPLGDAGAGLRMLKGELPADSHLIDTYRRPRPDLAAGAALAPHVHAMMDISDGLLIDAGRMAAASGVRIEIDLDRVPLSPAYRTALGSGSAARLAAATAGDDYRLLCAAAAVAAPFGDLTAIGRVTAGAGLALFDKGEAIPLPARLGWEHRFG